MSISWGLSPLGHCWQNLSLAQRWLIFLAVVVNDVPLACRWRQGGECPRQHGGLVLAERSPERKYARQTLQWRNHWEDRLHAPTRRDWFGLWCSWGDMCSLSWGLGSLQGREGGPGAHTHLTCSRMSVFLAMCCWETFPDVSAWPKWCLTHSRYAVCTDLRSCQQ